MKSSKTRYGITVIVAILFMAMPTLAQDAVNPCDMIVYDGQIQISPNTPPEQITILMFENGIQRNYSLGDYELTQTLIDLALDASENEWALAYFYRGCVYLQQDDTAAAASDFETYLDLSDDPQLLELVAAFIDGDMSAASNSTTRFEDEPAEFRDELTNYDAGRETILFHLSDGSGLSFGGRLIVNEARTSLAPQGGNDFIEFAPLAEAENFIMGGTINFTPLENESDLHACGLMGRTQREARTGLLNSVSLDGYLFIGFGSDGVGIFLQRAGGLGSTIGEETDADYTFEDGNEVLLIVINNRVNGFLNGVLVFEDIELEPMFGGAFALTLFSGGRTGIECGVENLFVYELVDNFPTTSCIAVADGNVNKRSGPGTNYAQQGLLIQDEPIAVIGQNVDDNGFTWWQLSDETWVREDVASVVGACSDIPEAPAP